MPQPLSSAPENLLGRRAFLVLAGAGLLSGCTTAYLPDGATYPGNLSREVSLAKINGVRANYGRPPVSWNTRLAQAARNQARLMADKGELSHTLGGTLRERVNAVGYHGAVGEDLAGGQSTLEGAIEGWLNSPGHRDTLLTPNFTEFGLAGATGRGELHTYWAIIFGGDAANWLRHVG